MSSLALGTDLPLDNVAIKAVAAADTDLWPARPRTCLPLPVLSGMGRANMCRDMMTRRSTTRRGKAIVGLGLRNRRPRQRASVLGAARRELGQVGLVASMRRFDADDASLLVRGHGRPLIARRCACAWSL